MFIKCKIEGNAPPASFYLGRPWRPYAKTVFIDCSMSDIVKPEGWHNWNKFDAEKTTFYAEYETRGKGANSEKRVSWSHQLTKDQAAQNNIEKIFKDWKPND